MVRDEEVEELMDDDDITKGLVLSEKIAAEAEPAAGGAGGPLGRHALELNAPRPDADPEGPALDRSFERPGAPVRRAAVLPCPYYVHRR